MSAYDLYTDIPYTTTDHHPRQVLDLYIPKLHDAASKFPVILYIHGGAFKFGSKESPFLPLRQIEHGYAIAAINYRRSGEAIFPAMIEDCKSAVRFLKSPAFADRHSLDADKIVVWGESAGGHAAAFLGTTSRSTTTPNGGPHDVGDHLDLSSSVRGVIDYYGPTDFLQMDDHLPPGFRTHNAADSPESAYLGAPITDVPDMVRAADPCTYVPDLPDPAPAFLVAHGTADTTVPAHMSELLVHALAARAVQCEYIPVPGTGHGFEGIDENQQKDLYERTDAFLRRVFAGAS